jgi:geranylgeranyl pyrophosphate synthase
MRYSLQAGGKRLRPVLALAAAELAGGRGATAPALPAAAALECVHTYSLIHDDLPCMDDDDLRRGRPTCHRAFDEATALLAGDALLTHAFALLATAYAARPALAHSLVRELADAAGSQRLIGGQMEDLLAEKKADATAGELDYIHLNKTAAMIEAALVLGALTGSAPESALSSVRRVGRHLGLAFQIIDDVLDATADSTTLGKTAGKDARADKTTYVKLHGIEASRRIADGHTASALAALGEIPGNRTFLAALISNLLRRAA